MENSEALKIIKDNQWPQPVSSMNPKDSETYKYYWYIVILSIKRIIKKENTVSNE